MSRGSPMLGLRVSPETMEAIREALASQQARTVGVPLDLCGWLRRAVQRELAHRARSNRPRPNRSRTGRAGARRDAQRQAKIMGGASAGG